MNKILGVAVFLGICLGCFYIIEGSDGKKYREHILQLEQEKTSIQRKLEGAVARSKEYEQKWEVLHDAISDNASMSDDDVASMSDDDVLASSRGD